MPERLPFAMEGGVDTVTPRALIPTGGLSTKQNLRSVNSTVGKRSLRMRRGQTRLHTNEITSRTTKTIAQYVDRAGTKHFYAQLDNGAVYKADTAPPGTATEFSTGGNVNYIAATSNTVPAMWAELQKYSLFADNARLLAYSGQTQRISKFVVYESASAPGAIPTQGEDYTNQVTDDDTTRIATLDSFGTNGATDVIYIRTMLPATLFNWTVQNTNGNTSVVTINYWKDGSGWTTVGTVTDTTLSSGKTLGQNGTMSWTTPAGEIPHYQFGQSGYWYQITVSAALDASVSVSQVTYETSKYHAVENVWDGVFVPAVEVQVDRATGAQSDEERWHNQPAGAANIGGLEAAKYFYISSIDRLVGLYIDVGLTPNIVYAKAVASSNGKMVVDDTNKKIKWSEARFLVNGFEEGQAITTTNFANGGNNITTRIKRVSASEITLDDGVTGLVAETESTDATIIFDNAGASMTMERWDGDSWVDCAEIDGTENFTKSGFITFYRAVDQPLNFNNIGFYTYWYRIKLDKRISNNTNINIQTMPYYDMDDFGRGRTVSVWKDRVVATYDKWPNYAYVSLKDNITYFNGFEYGILRAGDGRDNAIVWQGPFHNELLVLQEESGIRGGCTTLFEGKNPPTYGKLKLSTWIGGMNAKSAVVVENVFAGAETTKEYKKIAFWLSREGVMACDGRWIQRISDPIGNYFDTEETECVNLAQTDEMWLAYDMTYHVLRLGLVSGASATACNIFPVFDLKDMSWGFDVFAQDLSCMANIEASDGKTMIQVAGGADDGWLYRSNTGLNDVSTAIDCQAVFEVDGKGRKVFLKGGNIRSKVLTGDIVVAVAARGSTTYATIDTITPAVVVANDDYSRDRFKGHRPQDQFADHLSIRLRNNGASEDMHLYGMTADFEFAEFKEH